MTDIKRTMIASLLIEQATELKGKRPTELGFEDLVDVVQGVVKNCSIPAVVKSLPTDECVEQWWAEGKDQQKGFWQEAPYRTNGDVVEEIKTALKYFITVWQ